MQHRFTLTILLLFSLWTSTSAQQLKVGDKFPFKKLGKIKSLHKGNPYTIVTFIPSMSDDCEYASMLTSAYYWYFRDTLLDSRNLGWNPKKTNNRNPQMIFITKDDKHYYSIKIIDNQNVRFLNKSRIIYSLDSYKRKRVYTLADSLGAIYQSFHIASDSLNSSAVVFLVDKNKRIHWVDDNYRAQGEHLNPLVQAVHKMLGIEKRLSTIPNNIGLKVGDVAPDFFLTTHNKSLLDLCKESPVLLSFYPAAFSGSFPKRDWSKVTLEKEMSCSGQAVLLSINTNNTFTNRILITSSTDKMLNAWKNELGVKGVTYLNDIDYSISKLYGAFDDKTYYNNRVTVIIDKSGKIAYYDDDFNANDSATINKIMEELGAISIK